mgnify:CR=1 FL=1
MKGLKIALIASSVLLTACETMPDRDPEFAPVNPGALRPPEQKTGSIYQSNYDMRLFEDHTAKRIGDIITVLLNERTQARKDANTEIKKEMDFEMAAPTLAGVDPATFLGKNIFNNNITSNREFKGEADSDQSNSLSGSISVSVVEVLPNGYLKVRGEKRVTLNQGNEYIRVSGIVRPADLDSNNSISSNLIADATIMYVGDGALAEGNRIGWAARIFNHWLFPF